MQTLTFVPTLLPATSAAPDSLPCLRRRAPRARLRRRRSGESFKFGCKATGNRVHPLLRYRKIRFIVAWLSLSLSRPLSFICAASMHRTLHPALRCHTTLDIERAILLIIFIENYSQVSVLALRRCFDRESWIFCTHAPKHFHYASLLYKERSTIIDRIYFKCVCVY